MTPETEALIARLEITYMNRRDGLPGRSQYVNPDGPQAAATIREQATEIERLRTNISHCQGRFLNINIILASGGTKREAIALADVGEDCCRGYLTGAWSEEARKALGEQP